MVHRLTIEDLIAYEDKVWGRMTGRGTHKKQFGPLPPTGKKFEITVIDIMKFKNGKLIEIPSNWTELRDKWWTFHTVRTITSLIAFVLIAWAATIQKQQTK